MILSLVSFIGFIYAFCFKVDFKMATVAFFETFFCCILAIMTENRPRKTEYQRKIDNRVHNQGLGLLVVLTITVVVILFFSSCSSSKYGCGNGVNPRMTWNKMVYRINRP